VNFRLCRLPNFDLAGIHYRDVLLSETFSDGGILGTLFFSRHMMTLDFSIRRLYLRPGKQFDRVAPYDMSGLSIARKDSHTIAHEVDPGSPADKAGIQANDILLTINAKPAEDYDIADLHDLLRSGDGKVITITFRRNNVDQTTTLTLHRVL
jgi:membrane-associated protease RseP (regulator of RpoE activity)